MDFGFRGVRWLLNWLKWFELKFVVVLFLVQFTRLIPPFEICVFFKWTLMWRCTKFNWKLPILSIKRAHWPEHVPKLWGENKQICQCLNVCKMCDLCNSLYRIDINYYPLYLQRQLNWITDKHKKQRPISVINKKNWVKKKKLITT